MLRNFWEGGKLADLELERAVLAENAGITHIAGIDEAGRGALAGPVVAGAVILPLNNPDAMAKLATVNDSKQLSKKKRELFYALITELAVTWGVGKMPATMVDEIGILPANRQAMIQALNQLTPPADYLLIDGRVRLKNATTTTTIHRSWRQAKA